MTDSTDKKLTGAENVRWDLSEMYSGLDDPQIDADVAEFERLAAEFDVNYRGRLKERLGAAFADQAAMGELSNKVLVYLYLRLSQDTGNAAAKAKMADAEKRLAVASAEHLVFFGLELASLSDEEISAQGQDSVVAKHQPWIGVQRLFKDYLLSETVESALAKRDPFGAGAWAEFFDEFESDLRFPWEEDGQPVQLPLTKILKLMSDEKDAGVRARALKVVNDGLGGHFAKYSAETLYQTVGAKEVEDRDRGYRHPMQARNLGSQIPDEVVEALHRAVLEEAAPLAQRFYRLKAAHLGLPILKWSDRNAPMPFSDDAKVGWDEAVRVVVEAYESFSPTLAVMIREFLAKGRIDAPVTAGRRGGAYNYSITLPGGRVRSYTFLNFMGTNRDVSTLAHELGHGVHGILAGEAQGTLMMHAPMAYAETASVFGENVTFQRQLAAARERGVEPALALVMGKLDDIANTVVRQVSFSDFERALHGHDGATLTRQPISKRSVAELGELWFQVTERYYGAPGKVFVYDDIRHLWSYIGHFHRPFYVYAYAFGELLTHSLYALKDELGDRFEPLYLDLLRSGSTKDVVELLAPFGIDPRDPEFWRKGIAVSLAKYLAEAEELSRQMGVTIPE
jgi:oligoendopeptidase F